MNLLLGRHSSKALFLAILAVFTAACGSEAPMHDQGPDFRPGLAVPVLEPTTGEWVNDNTWGNQYRGVMPGSEGYPLQILKNSRLYGPPAVHSVNLFRSDDRLAENADIRARVTYGAGGVQSEFFCDWTQGQQFSIVANTLTLAAVTYRPSLAVAYSSADGTVFFGATVGKGGGGAVRPLTFTESSLVLQAATTGNWFVPDFAVGVRVYLLDNNDPSVPSGVALALLLGGLTLASYDAQVCAGGRELPLPGGASELSIVNNSGSAQLVVVQWVLGL